MIVNIKNHQFNIITNASLSEIELNYNDIDYNFKKFYCITVNDINDNTIINKAIGYDDQDPIFCFSELIEGFQIINGKFIHILEFNGKEKKLEFILPIIKTFYLDKDLIVIYEIGVSKISSETKKIISDTKFLDIIEDFEIKLYEKTINFNLADGSNKIFDI